MGVQRSRTVTRPARTLWWIVPAAVVGGSLVYGAGAQLWYRLVTSAADQPATTDSCALGTTDATAFRALIAKVVADRSNGGGGCAGQDDEVHCFEDAVKTRIARYAGDADGGMEKRMLAMHAVMRANKAVLLSQATVPPQPRTSVRGFSNDGRVLAESAGPSLVRRAETFTYALDTREIGLSAPSLGPDSNKRRNLLSFDEGRTRNPGGLYAIAEVTITLADPALNYPDDVETGAVEEKVDYIEAAWSHRRSDKESHPLDRKPLPSDNVHEMASLCPVRPAWLDVPAVKANPPGTPTADERRKAFFDFIKKMQ